MAAKAVANLIAQQLSGIFSGIDADNIQSSIWAGVLELCDLTLNKTALNPKLGSVRILSSQIEKVHQLNNLQPVTSRRSIYMFHGIVLRMNQVH